MIPHNYIQLTGITSRVSRYLADVRFCIFRTLWRKRGAGMLPVKYILCHANHRSRSPRRVSSSARVWRSGGIGEVWKDWRGWIRLETSPIPPDLHMRADKETRGEVALGCRVGEPLCITHGYRQIPTVDSMPPPPTTLHSLSIVTSAQDARKPYITMGILLADFLYYWRGRGVEGVGPRCVALFHLTFFSGPQKPWEYHCYIRASL